MKKLKFALLSVALTAAAGQASAAVVFTENWGFDPTGAGIGAGTIMPIDELNYLATSFTSNPAGTAPGTAFRDVGRFGATGFQNDGSVIPAGVSGLGVGYEISAVFDFTGVNGATVANNTAFTFDPGGVMNIFIDPVLNNTNFAGASDGTNILSLTINTGSGNINFGNPAGVDGNVDILFDVVSAAPGYWFLDTDGDGTADTDLSTLAGTTIALTDSNNNITDPTAAVKADFLASTGLGDNSPPADIYTLNDGSATIGADVPEPSIIALLSLGLLSMGAVARRKA